MPPITDLTPLIHDVGTALHELVRPNRVQLVQREKPRIESQGFTPIATGTALQMLTRATWDDGIPRKATVFLQTQGSTQDVGGVLGMVARISCGGMGRNNVRYWSGFPAIVAVEGNPILVEAQSCTLPVTYALSAANQNAPGGPAFAPQSSASVMCQAIVTEGWTDLPGPSQIASFATPAIAGNQPAPIVTGPVFVQAMTIKNCNASAAVQLVIGDRNATALLAGRFNPQSSVIVPAASSIGLGVDALGPFFRGLCVAAVSNLAAGGPTFGGYDANGANVVIDVWGQFLVS